MFSIDTHFRFKKRIGALYAVAALVLLAMASTDAAAHPRHAHAEESHDVEWTELSADEAKEFDTLKARVEEAPHDADASLALARFAATQARRLDDTNLLRFAQTVLNNFNDTETAPIEALLIRANVKQIDHRFGEALDDLGVVLQRQPGNPQALLSRAFIQATTGEAGAAAQDCAMLTPAVSVYVRETCAARARSISGSSDYPLRRLDAMLTLIEPRSAAERAFALSVAGEIAARTGADDVAERYLRELLDDDPRAVYPRAALAEFLIDRGRYAHARAVIGDAHTEALLLMRILAASGDDDSGANRAAE